MADKQELIKLIQSSKRIAFLTGAGVSTSSGVPDFQTIDDGWTFDVPRNEATSIAFFNSNRKKFWEAYRYLFKNKNLEGIAPTPFHRAVAALEQAGKDVVVLTQNIDGLHSEAGSSMVLEMHGNLRDVICNRPSCDYREIMNDEHGPDSRCPKCNKHLRPDTVLFGETPRGFGDAKEVALGADLFVVAGTALEVGPVNDLPRYREWYFPERPTLWVNKASQPYGYRFSHHFSGSTDDFSEILIAGSEKLTLPAI